jgi:hypothetical protein
MDHRSIESGYSRNTLGNGFHTADTPILIGLVVTRFKANCHFFQCPIGEAKCFEDLQDPGLQGVSTAISLNSMRHDVRHTCSPSACPVKILADRLSMILVFTPSRASHSAAIYLDDISWTCLWDISRIGFTYPAGPAPTIKTSTSLSRGEASSPGIFANFDFLFWQEAC